VNYALWLLAQGQHQPSGALALVDKLARAPLSTVLAVVAACTVVRLALAPYLARVEPHRRTGFFSGVRLFNELLDAIVYAGVVVFMLIRPFAIQTFFIPTGSMLETLQIQDFIVANKFVYRIGEPKHGDIIVFKPPAYGLLPGQGDSDYIKRCIGLPGDLIEIIDGVLYRNGEKVPEPYVTHHDPTSFKLVEHKGRIYPVRYAAGHANSGPVWSESAREFAATSREEELELLNAPPVRIPEGYFLPMGDNRAGSFDGRFWGLVPRKSLIGRSEIIWLPVSRWRITR
jgi:signal peptidase I